MIKLLFLRRVVGHSMNPTLREGQIVVASSLFRAKTGDVVIAKVNGIEVVKRIKSSGFKQIKLASDARGHGLYATVKREDIVGKAIFSLKR